jgi:hypothetical protein
MPGAAAWTLLLLHATVATSGSTTATKARLFFMILSALTVVIASPSESSICQSERRRNHRRILPGILSLGHIRSFNRKSLETAGKRQMSRAAANLSCHSLQHISREYIDAAEACALAHQFIESLFAISVDGCYILKVDNRLAV